MALIGAIIGDIIGSQYEFPSMRPDDLDWKHCELFGKDCEFTDDTVMSIATKYAIDKKESFEKTYRYFYSLYPNVGYGDMFEKWAEKRINKPYKSYGNGSAMRVSYIGDYAQDTNTVTKLAQTSAECTHNSLSGILGAVVVANIIAMANLKYTKSDIYKFTHKAYRNHFYDCSESLESLCRPHTYYTWSDTCDKTVPIAIRCFLESQDYESCIRNCFRLSCDMDTMCCIAGGIAEAYYGTTGFDNKAILRKYLDTYLYNCIENILHGG